MKLTGIDCQIPSKKVLNENIIELVKHYSGSSYNNNIDELEIFVRRLLLTTGINSRFWRQENEKPIDFIIESVENALKMSGLQKNDIDLVIYSSIDRGFIEPANASFICKALGLLNVRSFDIVDACMGWASAVQVANSFLISSSSVKSVLIINSEFPMDSQGAVLPDNFKIKDNDELRWKSASFTLGEGASACIFQKDASVNNNFEFLEHAQHAESCTVPLPNYEKYMSDLNGNLCQPLSFYAYSSSLIKDGINPSISVLQSLLKKLNYEPKIIFPHSVSKKIIRDASFKAGIQSLICSSFSDLGNLATVSVPSSIKKALKENLISQNEKGVVWIGSAGMKFSAFEIQL
ncbi:MAG: hypothetical protein M3R36_16930 [Bacteroidota bacterium]|nr:hypothetical protein [Bacteroidota bacterium]